MKTTYPLIALAILFCNTLAFAQLGGTGPFDVKVSGVAQNLNYQQIRARTNVVGTATNFTFALKSTTTNFTVDSAWLLALLGNSYHTNFPAGSILMSRHLVDFFVTDSTGSNSFFPDDVLGGSDPSVTLFSGVETYTSIYSNPEQRPWTAGTDTESTPFVCTITYDDSAMTNTTDGTHTTFSWTALVQTSYSENAASGVGTFKNITMDIIGSGSVRGQPGVIFSGTIRAKLSN